MESPVVPRSFFPVESPVVPRSSSGGVSCSPAPGRRVAEERGRCRFRAPLSLPLSFGKNPQRFDARRQLCSQNRKSGSKICTKGIHKREIFRFHRRTGRSRMCRARQSSVNGSFVPFGLKPWFAPMQHYLTHVFPHTA